MDAIPALLADLDLTLEDSGHSLALTFDAKSDNSGIASLIRRLNEAGIEFRDLRTEESSLEDIFVSLVSEAP
jgi:ABC-2 type transport system ATP-binding protein